MNRSFSFAFVSFYVERMLFAERDRTAGEEIKVI